MSFLRSRRWLVVAGLYGAVLSAPLYAQSGGGAVPPPTVSTGSVPPPAVPKDWIPRLTGVPAQSTDHGTILLAGTEYDDRTLLVAFFTGTPADRIETDLGIFPTEETRESGGDAYYLTFSRPGDLFPAADALNDLPEVRSANLIPFQGSTAVSPPDFQNPTKGGGVADSAAATQSLWPGDTDGDFNWTIEDVTLTLKAAIGLTALPPLAAARADVNRNGKIDIRDAVLSLGLVVGKGLPPPYGYGS
jgi:hypothetical protein